MIATGQWSDEDLMRASDGELSTKDMARLEIACATDPALAARRAQFSALRRLASEGFPAVVDQRDAELSRLISRADSQPHATSWPDWLKGTFAPRRVAIWGTAATACFVAGLMIGQWTGPSSTTAGFALTQGRLIADAELVRVLDGRLAAQAADNDGRSVGLTFRDADGRWCRTFLSTRESVAGLTCREDDGWALEALAGTVPARSELRTAASETPDLILAAVDTKIAGEVLDASEEARARDGGWR